MIKIEDVFDDVKIQISELECLTKSLENALQYCADSSEEDCWHLVPLARIMLEKIDKLIDGYEELEGEVYRKFILK